PAVDPVRPGEEQLARGGGRQLVSAGAENHRLVAGQPLAPPPPPLGHPGPGRARLDVVLLPSQRNGHPVRIRTGAAPRGSPPPDPRPDRLPAPWRAAWRPRPPVGPAPPSPTTRRRPP